MIKIKKKATITSDYPPYQYVWNTDDSCATFSNKNGTTSKTEIETYIYLANEACFTDATITFIVIDDNGCTTTENVAISNVCDNVTLNPISEQNTTFTVSGASSGSQGLIFEWSYDDRMFTYTNQIDSPFVSTLQLDLNTSSESLPLSSVVSVTATDKLTGCINTSNYTYTICIPTAQGIQVELTKNNPAATQYSSPVITFPDLIGCDNLTADWCTAKFELPSGFHVYTEQDVATQTSTNGGTSTTSF